MSAVDIEKRDMKKRDMKKRDTKKKYIREKDMRKKDMKKRDTKKKRHEEKRHEEIRQEERKHEHRRSENIRNEKAEDMKTLEIKKKNTSGVPWTIMTLEGFKCSKMVWAEAASERPPKSTNETGHRICTLTTFEIDFVATSALSFSGTVGRKW